MGNFSWTHLLLSVLIIIFAAVGYTWLVIVLAAIIAIFSIFGVCSYKKGYYNKKESYAKKEVKPARRKR